MKQAELLAILNNHVDKSDVYLQTQEGLECGLAIYTMTERRAGDTKLALPHDQTSALF